MGDRKVKRRSKEEKTKKERKGGNKINLVSRILMILFTVAVLVILGIVIYLNILPIKYLITICAALFVLCAVGNFVVFRKKTLKAVKVALSVIAIVGTAVCTFAGLKLAKTLDFLGDMSTETVNAKTYSVVVLKESEYTKLEDVQYRLLLYYDNELNQTQPAIDKLTAAMTVVTEKTDDVHELAKKLLEKEVDAILIEDSYYAIIEEDDEAFREKIKAIYTFTLEDAIATIAKDVSVTDEPFIVFISGIDSYGKISSVARSDVNMLGVVNPKTKQVLLVNTPRDYYVKLHGTSGYRDKLTHAGIYGIDMSVKTMEDLYKIDVNYYVRVNFTSLIDIINAIGGIEVYSEYSFTSRIGNYKFKKGYNQMNGKQALGFARERYSFKDGDRMRGQNQQAVINAMIKKVCSSKTILTKFDALLDSLKGSFQTNMEYTKMVDLVRMQISDGAQWNVSSISVDGSGSSERTYSMGKTRLSVLIPFAGSVKQASKLINQVLDGEMLEEGTIDISKYNDYLVVSRGVYETEKKEEEKKEETEKVPESSSGNTSDNTTGTGDSSENVDNNDKPQQGENTGGDTTVDNNTSGENGNNGGSVDNSGNNNNTDKEENGSGKAPEVNPPENSGTPEDKPEQNEGNTNNGTSGDATGSTNEQPSAPESSEDNTTASGNSNSQENTNQNEEVAQSNE